MNNEGLVSGAGEREPQRCVRWKYYWRWRMPKLETIRTAVLHLWPRSGLIPKPGSEAGARAGSILPLSGVFCPWT